MAGPKKIQKVHMEFNAEGVPGKHEYQVESLESEGLASIDMPFHDDKFSPRNFVMNIYGDGVASGDISYDLFRYVIGQTEGMSQQAQQKLEEQKTKNEFLRDIDPHFFSFEKYRDRKFPKMVYADVTERDMFGNAPIKATTLNSERGGIWAWTGLRKLEIQVDGLLQTEDPGSDEKKFAVLYWASVDSKGIAPLLEHKVRISDSEDPSEKQIYTVFYDTDAMGDELVEIGKENQRALFDGRFELHYRTKHKKEAWGFPVQIYVHDTRDNKNLTNKNVVSIDFGTSSTCAAYRHGAVPQLLSLSGPYKRREDAIDKEYENPTNLMIYNWEELRNQWQQDNPDAPFLLSHRPGVKPEDADYDSGYLVAEVFKNIDDPDGHRNTRAILTDLKNIPTLLAAHQARDFVPLNDRSGHPIGVTDAVEGENDATFNPISFYGYLLGRAINNPANHKYFTTYQISYPVSYDDNMKKKIRDALGYGILRSLPKPVQESLDPNTAITTPYQESVASIGTIVGGDFLPDEIDTPLMLSIFDIGGGTLDTSYSIVTEDDSGETEYKIVLLATGGDGKAGGERLIHKLAFKIYRDNKELMEQNNISIILPPGDPLPAGFKKSLLPDPGDPIGESNLHVLSEQLARYLFQSEIPLDSPLDQILGPHFPEEFKDLAQNQFKVKLRDIDSVEVELLIDVKLLADDNEDEDETVGGFLQQQLRRIVGNYRREMIDYLKDKRWKMEECGVDLGWDQNPEPDISNVMIFLAGNASRQIYLSEIMEEFFPGLTIRRIDDNVNDDDESSQREKKAKTHEEITITAKTAVAFGQLELGNYKIDDEAIRVGDPETGISPFGFFVGYVRRRKFIPVLNKSDNSRDWKPANKLDMVTHAVNLVYSENNDESLTDKKGLTEIIEPEDDSRTWLYIRVYDQDSDCIEYRLGAMGEKFDPNEESDPTKVLRLER